MSADPPIDRTEPSPAAAASRPMSDQTNDSAGGEPAPVLLKSPADGTPKPITTPRELAALVAGLAAGHGPVAVDAERASGYRYSQRAYLVQLRRAGYGTALIDPIPLPDLSSVGAALSGVEWILHAATQDLPCLAELGMVPDALFDTELVGRLLGSERVALGTMVTQYLNVALEKGHSAADWSTRPLPADWLDYAALDVELLIELRTVLIAELDRTGKRAWAEQECAAILAAVPPPPRTDPWRRTSGLHGLRNRRQLALVQALWEARDRRASERDVAPGRVLPDAAIITAAKANPRQISDLAALPVFGGPRQRRLNGYWLAALEAGRAVDDAELPPVSQVSPDPDAMPSVSRWRDRDPDAAARLAAAKEVVTAVAEEHQVVGQNLLAGDIVRRLAWRPGPDLSPAGVAIRLGELGARPWQAELVAEPLSAALLTAPEPTS